MRAFLTLVVVLALALGYMAGQAWPLSPVLPVSAPPAAAAAASAAAAPAALSEKAPPEGLTSGEQRVIDVFRTASASVVFVTTIALRRSLFSLDVMRIPQNTGSGFVWDSDGHIVTNYHVVEGGRAFSVTLADQTTLDADVVGVSQDNDLAVLQVKAPKDKLPPIDIGSSSSLVVGQTVMAVGNPFGLDHTLTVGVVSALGRELEAPNGRTIRGVIQTDAAINPGNSGGPLLDSSGRVVGINSAIYSPSGVSAGIGFAVPIDTIKRLVPQIIEYGKPIRPGVGIHVLSDSWTERLGLQGVVIRDVTPDSPADRAGLVGLRRDRSGRILLGDVIVAVDGNPVQDSDDLMHDFETRGVGGEVTVTVERDDQRRDVRMKLVALE